MRVLQEDPLVYLLGKKPFFPKIEENSKFDDLIAVGGDFSPLRLIEAYNNGIFPWYVEHDIIYWFSPMVRMLINCSDIKISKSLRKTIDKNIYDVKFNTAFDDVIENCSTIKRKHEDSTWITDSFKSGYKDLNRLGIAKSVEVYFEGELVGGLYGLLMNGNFFGESMFSKKSDASKVALVFLADKLEKENKNSFIDCQIPSPHLKKMGGYEINRESYLKLL